MSKQEWSRGHEPNVHPRPRTQGILRVTEVAPPISPKGDLCGEAGDGLLAKARQRIAEIESDLGIVREQERAVRRNWEEWMALAEKLTEKLELAEADKARALVAVDEWRKRAEGADAFTVMRLRDALGQANCDLESARGLCASQAIEIAELERALAKAKGAKR